MSKLILVAISMLLSLALVGAALPSPQTTNQAATNPCSVRKKQGHPYPQPCPPGSTVTTAGDTTTIITGESIFPKPPVDPFTKPPGTNFLPTIYTNLFDGSGVEMANTLPSTPTIPYNLHDGDPVVTQINPTSPTDDLSAIFETVTRLSLKERKEAADEEAIRKSIQFGIDILEGNPVENRAYSSLPLLHYTGPDKVKKVTPVFDSTGKLTGGNVVVHQVWYDSHIESDTSFLDPSAVTDVPWTVTYTVDVLSRGGDDFSPYVMYYDDPALTSPNPPLPNAGMDQSFFPMEEGTRTVFRIRMTAGKYYNLVYTWGWRMHPPRVQVMENANKKAAVNGVNQTLVQWEQSVFGASPRSSEENKLKAIGMIGDLSPAKRMWTAMREARELARQRQYRQVAGKMSEARDALGDWSDRTSLPRTGRNRVAVDKSSDLTLLYVNNTIYAEMADRSENIADSIRIDFPQWKMRGATLKVTLINGDYYEHAYQNVDFGGSRGWENQFKSSVKFGGSGCWFTFGRNYWWMNIPNTSKGDLSVVVPAATRAPYRAATRKVHITYNYEPSRRLRFYQFDPLHHDVAVMSIH